MISRGVVQLERVKARGIVPPSTVELREPTEHLRAKVGRSPRAKRHLNHKRNLRAAR
jgi:hypothetical protein